MPYNPKAVRERALLIDLHEAIARVCARDECTPEGALEQIRNMIVDRAIHPARWDPDPGDPPPRVGGFWREARIDPDSCRVWDDYEQGSYPDIWQRYPRDDGLDDSSDLPLPRPPEWRVLLLDKAEFEAVCEAIWATEEKAAPQPDEAPLGSEPVRKARRHGKVERLIDETYEGGLLPAGIRPSQIMSDVKAKTGLTISRSGLYAYLNRPSDG